MARHAAGDRMNGVGDFDAAFLELVGEGFHAVLRLRDRHSVSGNENNFARIREHDGDVVGAGAANLLRSSAAGCDLLAARRAERAEQYVGERPVHRAAHEDRQQRAARTDQARRR